MLPSKLKSPGLFVVELRISNLIRLILGAVFSLDYAVDNIREGRATDVPGNAQAELIFFIQIVQNIKGG